MRLFQGDFAKQTEYSKDPLRIAERFAKLAVRDMHIVDLDGALSGEQQNSETIQAIAEQTALSIQVGGGIRTGAAVGNWLGQGVKRCVIGSIAVQSPDTVLGWAEDFGPDSIVLALDVIMQGNGTPFLATDGWTKTSTTPLWDCLDRFTDAGILNVLCTDISRDGALSGPNVQLYVAILKRYPGLRLQASGGVRNIADLHDLRTNGLPAAITGRALLDGQITSDEVAAFPQDA